MQIEITIDERYKEPKVIIMTDRITEEVTGIINKFSNEHTQVIAGFIDGNVEILEPIAIYRVYAERGKVFAETNNGKYLLRLRLYEVEQRFENLSFVRISNSDIVNLKSVKSFDLSLTGTIRITLLNGTVTYVSRRFVAKIKKKLGI